MAERERTKDTTAEQVKDENDHEDHAMLCRHCRSERKCLELCLRSTERPMEQQVSIEI